MGVIKVSEEVFAVGAQDPDRELFDELIPLPDGTGYNAYIVRGKDRTALIDTVDPTKTDTLLKNLGYLGIKKLDYIIANHAEQDHSGSLSEVRKKYPEAKIVTNKKCSEFLIDLLDVSESDFVIVGDREKLDLGNRTLEFVLAPWVHWPETMMTYLYEDKILFSCDLFGSHLAFDDDDAFAKEGCTLYSCAKRYYAEIMMPFRKLIAKHLKTLEAYDIEMIAPSHGPIYTNPEYILEAYGDWVSDDVKKEIMVVFVSMHGSTRAAVDILERELIGRGLETKVFDLTKSDVGELAMAAVDSAAIILCSPTMLVGPHPSAVYFAYLLGILKPKTKLFGQIISYGWAGQAAATISKLIETWDLKELEAVEIRGNPKGDDIENIRFLAKEIASGVSNLRSD